MKTLLYSELVPWYHLLDPLDDHLDEATYYLDAFNTYLPPALRPCLSWGVAPVTTRIISKIASSVP